MKVNALIAGLVFLSVMVPCMAAAAPAFSGITANADSAETVVNNPAGMTRLTQPGVYGNPSIFYTKSKDEVTIKNTGQKQTSSDDSVFALPGIYYAHPVGERWAVGIGPNAARTSQSALLNAEQVLADPDILHQRLKAKNPGYQGQAQFAQDPSLGLVGDFTGSKISDLSPLAGIPFGALDLRGQSVSNLKPLQGMPLRLLAIEDTKVSGLEPLKGMKLQKLYLNNTPLSDLRPLAGMPLEELMLVGTKVKDLKALAGMPLQSLWLNGTPVADISPLASCPLVSLTLEGTVVADLKTLSKMAGLKRLHIGKTKVSDLTPLKPLKLERLVFTPGNIKKGLDVARNMKTLTEVGTTLETLMPANEFWSRLEQRKGK